MSEDKKNEIEQHKVKAEIRREVQRTEHLTQTVVAAVAEVEDYFRKLPRRKQ